MHQSHHGQEEGIGRETPQVRAAHCLAQALCEHLALLSFDASHPSQLAIPGCNEGVDLLFSQRRQRKVWYSLKPPGRILIGKRTTGDHNMTLRIASDTGSNHITHESTLRCSRYFV